MNSEKQSAALNSIFAAAFLTAMKVVVGVLTGSLGIISEALHSVLDLLATVITFLAVRFSDKPADAQHHYGHGKMESFSALIETVLLLVTCVWIGYEAIDKLFFGKSVEMTGALWGALVMAVSIAVNSTRVVVLKRAAKKYGSQALEADALHFSSDIWSSAVVTGGLVCVWIGETFHIPALRYADPIAALGVAVLVIRVSLKLGRETIDVLLDTAPRGMKEMIEKELSAIPDVVQIESVRIRPSGAVKYIDLNIGVEALRDHKSVHWLVGEIKDRVTVLVPNSDIMVSTYPVEPLSPDDININRALENIVDQVPDCLNVHNVHVYELDGKKQVTAHIEVRENLTLNATHGLSHEIMGRLKSEIPCIDNVNLSFERAERALPSEEITAAAPDLVGSIKEAVDGISGDLDCHEIRLYRCGGKVTTFLHCGVREEFTVDKLELLSDNIKRRLKSAVSQLENVHIHFEPIEDE
ncbi:cation diffusion facilitator family transporter [Sporobacter termitidis DSM 10068]|uniref:Cation diffusion facilitator family transporter n=1 Tax=Sporobacter termitidis DSM 10068 TaxID=1123282 RepID=A0A1M5XPL1_9FIRM|nr:cation diffusion facilitator family transporter [Sporobacter termitidis]SHI01765.1 cation diffusion facilitator family transporter [Sporobacter termitidis DSM 10068]